MSRKDLKPHEPWRAALREGDPAGAEPGLDPGEIERMRRRVLAARAEPRRRLAFTPVWAAALAAATLILAAGLWRTLPQAPPAVAVRNTPPVPAEPAPPAARPTPPAVPPSPPEPEAPRARPAPAPAAPVRAPRPEARVAQLQEPELSESYTEPDPELVEEAVLSAALDDAAMADAADGAQPRQVQFSTPGGTRIIWMLAPEDPSTDEAAPVRPEESNE